eukprot:1161564-Pelagomonas_calceolata.AAC.10
MSVHRNAGKCHVHIEAAQPRACKASYQHSHHSTCVIDNILHIEGLSITRQVTDASKTKQASTWTHRATQQASRLQTHGVHALTHRNNALKVLVGFVTNRVATPAPAAAVMCTKGVELTLRPACA